MLASICKMINVVPNSIKTLEILVQIILHRYFNYSYCVTFILEQDFDLKIPDERSFIKLNADNEEKLINLTLTASEMGCSDYVVQMSEPQIFLENFELVTHLGNSRRSDRKIIFLPTFTKVNALKLLKIIRVKETTYIPNILLIIPAKSFDKCENYDLITHKFVGPDSEVHNPVYLDEWNGCTETFNTNVSLFPHKMDNLLGKTVTAAGFNYNPFTILDLDEEVTANGRDGIDVRIVDELCRRINCTFKILRDDAHAWGYIYENGTGNGVLGNLFKDRADLAISGLGAWYYVYQRLDFSSYGIKCIITAIAPAPKLRSKWEMPFLPFHWIMWTIIAILSGYCCLALVLAQNCSTDGVVFLTYRIIVAQPQPDYKILKWNVRKITGWLLITFLIVNSAYGAGMATTFTIPKFEKSIDTMQDLIDRDMTWAAIHEAFTFTLLTSDEPKIKKLVSLFHKYDPAVIKQKLYEKNLAYAVVRLETGATSIQHADRNIVTEYMMMLEDFYSELSLIMGRKSSPILNKLSQLMLRLHENGLLLAWENQIALKYMDYKVQLAMKFSRLKPEVTIEPLGYQHVVGVFMIYLGGVVISIIVFVSETIKGKKKHQY